MKITYNVQSCFNRPLYLKCFVFPIRDNTQENCFFQISSYSVHIYAQFTKKTKGQVPLGPLLGKQNILVS